MNTQMFERAYKPLYGSAKDLLNADDWAKTYKGQSLDDDEYFKLWAAQNKFFSLPNKQYGIKHKGVLFPFSEDDLRIRFNTYKTDNTDYKKKLGASDVARISDIRKRSAFIGAVIVAAAVKWAYSRLGKEAREANKKLKEKQASYEKRLASYEKQLKNALKSANDANASAMDAMKKADEQRIDDLKEKSVSSKPKSIVKKSVSPSLIRNKNRR